MRFVLEKIAFDKSYLKIKKSIKVAHCNKDVAPGKNLKN